MNHTSSLRLFIRKPYVSSYQFSFFIPRVVGGIRNHRRQPSLSGTDDQKDGAHDRSMSSLGSYPSEKVNQNHKINPSSDDWRHQAKKFSLIQPRSTDYLMWNRCDHLEESIYDNLESSSCERLESGMVLLKNHISLSDQVEIVNICQEFGVGPGGFYQPCLSNGAKLRLQMMCFGMNWDPQTKYNKRVRSDGSEAPPLPDKLISLSETALEDARCASSKDEEIPSMYPDICIVNFYTSTGRLGLHQDRDESSYSLRRGLPVVSVSIGDAAEFLYGNTRDVEAAKKVVLESGDVLIFGGKSRHVFHGVKKIIPDSAPLPLLKQTMLRPGRLNLTFRQF